MRHFNGTSKNSRFIYDCYVFTQFDLGVSGQECIQRNLWVKNGRLRDTLDSDKIVGRMRFRLKSP